MSVYTADVVISNTPLPIDGGNPNPVNVTGAVSTTPTSSSTSAVTSVASSASSVNLLTLNTNRKAFSIYNDSTSILYLKLGATASNISYSAQVPPKGYYESQSVIYTGVVDGIWASANGFARITELS